MKKPKLKRLEKEIMDRWIRNHGACTFDIKKFDIILHDGGLFSIEKEKIMLPRSIGTKKLQMERLKLFLVRKNILLREPL